MPTYMQTRKAVKELILTVGLENLKNRHINDLRAEGYNSLDIANTINYFRFSPQAAKYRKE